MADTSKQVETHFNKKFKQFDDFYNPTKSGFSRLIDSYFRRSMQLRFERVIAGVSPYNGKRVLDVGCGAGRYSIALALNGIKACLGIDFAPNMIEEAEKRAKALGVDSICRFERTGFMEMEVDGVYDHVFAMGVLDYIKDPLTFVGKMVKSAEQSVMISFPSAGGFIQWCRGHYFRRIKKCPVYFYRETDVQRIAQESGAESFTIDKLAKDYFLTLNINQTKR